jgi:parallel beta-helix repeat protein
MKQKLLCDTAGDGRGKGRPAMMANVPGANTSARARRLIVAALTSLFVWGTYPAQAQVLPCGGTVGPEDHYASLSGPIEGCSADPALTINGPVTVDLNGFSISCAGSTTGIVVGGANARISNGSVVNCQDGIDVGGKGKHQLLKLTVTSTQNEVGDRGFRVRSDHNNLVNDSADQFNGEGFRIEGDDNRITNSLATGTTNEGFRINGNDNQITNSRSMENNNHGFRVGGNDNQLVNNQAEANVGEGFRLDGSGNRLVNNRADGNDDEGFRIRDGQNNTLINNSAEANGQSDGEAGIRIQGDDNTLRSNAFIDNVGDGILVTEGAEGNTVIHNVATGNGVTDLVDENIDCDNNQWSKNRFGTRSQDCIK